MAKGWPPAAMLFCLAAIAAPCTGGEAGSGPADAPVAAPRPDQVPRLTLTELDRLLRNADVAVDIRQTKERRWRAVRQLGETRSRYARPALLAVLHRREDDPQLLRLAVESLARIDDPCVVDDLIDLLADREYAVAALAAKSLQEITNREGRREQLPRDPASPARAEIQQNWRLWWKMNRHRFEEHGHRDLADWRPPPNAAGGRQRPPSTPVPSPVVVEFRRERLDHNNQWVKVKDDEVSWSHDRSRWIVLFANVPGVKRVRWLVKPWDDLHDPNVPWREFASGPADRPAEGRPGAGNWAITVEIEFDDGRKLLVGGAPEW